MLKTLAFAVASLAVCVACSSSDNTSSSSSGSSGNSSSGGSSSSGNSSSGSTTSSGSSTTTTKFSCSINGTCYKCPTEDAESKCLDPGPDQAGCTQTDSSYCSQ